MFVTHVECTVCRHRHEAGDVLTVCAACGQMLAVRYDLARAAGAVTKDELRGRPPGMYRFRELLPLAADEAPVTLGEGGTPLLALPRLAAHLGLRHLWAKDEGQNPTGTFKARGLGMAVSRAHTLGVTGLMIPSAGNAGGAAAVYGARAGIPVAVVVPRDTPAAAVAEAALAGAHVFTVEGTIATAGRVIAGVAPQIGWFDLATLKEPYRLEGKKTMGLELAEQLGWQTPEWLVYPTGGGTGLVGIWKAYAELAAMGWIGAAQPRFVAVQAEGCAPLVRAWEDKAETTTTWENPVTDAPGLRVPGPFAGRQMLRLLRETGGFPLPVSEPSIVEAQRLLARVEGIWTAPEAAATVAALLRLVDERQIDVIARVVLVFTGAGIKHPAPALPPPTHLEGGPEELLSRVRQVLGPIKRLDRAGQAG
ncbi:MAG TPA: threonine synthase [Candidatus Limnocylindria bacterium]|nr:threonine synthase [Candidatus Limnocylindria bacterium]